MTLDPEYAQLLAETTGLNTDEVGAPVSRQLIIGRTRLHLLDWGSTELQPLVLLHAGGLSARSWDPICAVLSREWRCIAVDQRGHGDSEWSPECDYAIPTHSADLAGVIDTLGLDSPVLIGASMGGANALYLAGRRQFKALVLVDIGPRLPPAEAKRIARQTTIAPIRATQEDFLPRSWSAASPNSAFIRASVLAGLRQRPDGRWMRKADSRPHEDPEFIARVFARERLLWQASRRVTCPTLLIRGGLSPFFSTENAAEFADAIPADVIQVTMPGAGHLVQQDDPRGLVAAIGDFLHAHVSSRRERPADTLPAGHHAREHPHRNISH